MRLNIKNIKVGFAGLLAVVLLDGCKKLDRFPYDSISDDNISVGSAESITRGTYAKMKEEYYYKTIHQIGEYGGDNVSLSGTTSDELFNFYRYTRSANSYYTARVWLFTYQMIGSINSLLPVLENYAAPEAEKESINHLIGENLLLRASAYFNCNNIFGRQYLDAGGANNNLGIPIKTTNDIDYFPPRSTVAQVYDQILSDATRAASYMKRSGSTLPKNNNYASQEVAWAFLSRIYLYMGDWEKAGLYADSVINSGRYSLLQGEAYQKYAQHVPEANSETIWCIRMVKDADFKDYFMDEYSVGAMYSTIDQVGWGEMYPSESYLNLLRRNPNDLRFSFISNQPQSGQDLWMIYVVGNETAKTYNYVWKKVQRSGNDYTIVQDANQYSSPTVQKETTAEGNTQYYVMSGGTRYNVWIEPALIDRNGYPKRYIMKCSYQEQQSQLYSPVLFRLAEMYLTRAEAKWHRNDFSGAVADLNVIRTRANVPLKTVAQAGTNAEILQWILNERRLELAWEAQRKYDILRNQQVIDRRYPGSHLTGTNYPLEILPTDPRVVEYIPQSEIDAYPIPLTQNPVN
ncbi:MULTISPECIES: RagB/SusD family nutrient uptake outer membrane protein [Bacteroidota]|nr:MULTISPECIES: RagB/SusD family nutrient uptake outer membrane protein [Bacteroidota]QRQ63197.1 RagB/SusD family nutrient uptake outer membrane protein [Sphingobacterium multivorum]SPZ95015.1 SusD family [Sphingobacterium multivorum]